jgi:hypothetical protein
MAFFPRKCCSSAHLLGVLEEEHQQLKLVAALVRRHLLPLLLQQLYRCVQLLQTHMWSCCCQVMLYMLQEGRLEGLAVLSIGCTLDQLQDMMVAAAGEQGRTASAGMVEEGWSDDPQVVRPCVA